MPTTEPFPFFFQGFMGPAYTTGLQENFPITAKTAAMLLIASLQEPRF